MKTRFKKWLAQIIKLERDVTDVYKSEFPEINAKEAKENLILYKARQIIEGDKYINGLFGEIMNASRSGRKYILTEKTGNSGFLTPQFLENKIKPYFENRGYKVKIVWDTTGYTYAYAKIIWEEEN